MVLAARLARLARLLRLELPVRVPPVLLGRQSLELGLLLDQKLAAVQTGLLRYLERG